MQKMSMDTLRRNLTAQRSIGEKWRIIGLNYPGVAYGTLSRIVNDQNYEPHKPSIRTALGLTNAVTVTPCSVCGSTRHKEHRNRKPDKSMRLSRVRNALHGYGSDS